MTTTNTVIISQVTFITITDIKVSIPENTGSSYESLDSSIQTTDGYSNAPDTNPMPIMPVTSYGVLSPRPPIFRPSTTRNSSTGMSIPRKMSASTTVAL